MAGLLLSGFYEEEDTAKHRFLALCPPDSALSTPTSLYADADEADHDTEPSPLRRLTELGWDCPDLRRLCSFGYSAAQLRRLLASVPPSLQAAVCRLAAAAVSDRGHAACTAMIEGGRVGEAEMVFSAAEERMRQAMEEDGETGYLEVVWDPATLRHTHVFLNDRYAALRGTVRPALLARLAAHDADLPSPPADFLATALHGLLRGREGFGTRYVRADCGGRAALVREDWRTRFDARGRVVRVRRCRIRRRYYLHYCTPLTACVARTPPPLLMPQPPL